MQYEVRLLLPAAGDDTEPPPSASELAGAIDHTRDWPEAAAAVARARAARVVVDELPSPERLPALVARVADAARDAVAVAVWWRPADRLVAPEALAAAVRDGDPLRVAVNLRWFHVEEGASDERVMDSVGLAPLGLPDVQCHFRGLDPAGVAAMLDELVRYLVAEGDVIEDGDTVPGVDGAPWPCRHEAALVDPPRDVVDVMPPAPHAARAN